MTEVHRAGSSTAGPRRTPLVLAILTLLAIVAGVVIYVVSSGSSTSGQQATTTSSLPSLEGGCRAVPSKALQVVPFEAETSGHSDVPVVAVCVDGQGPFPFAVSTGTGSTVITPALAQSLHLKASTTPGAQLRGTTCVATGSTASLAAWSMAGVKMASEPVVVATVPVEGLAVAPDGVIGADVLSRFGAVVLEYARHEMVLFQAETALPTGNVFIVGQPGSAPPSTLAAGSVAVSTPLRVLEGPTSTLAVMATTLGSNSGQFLADSGAANSEITPTAARSFKLHAGSSELDVWGAGCSDKASSFASGRWGFGGVTQPQRAMVSAQLPGSANAGVDGVVGADVLSTYRALIVDYLAGELWLEH